MRISAAIVSLCSSIVLLSSAIVLAQSSAEDERTARDLVAGGRLEEAIQLYEKLVRASPGDPQMLVNLSIVEYKAKRFRSAAAHAEAALQVAPRMTVANLFLGASYLELGLFKEATPRLEQFLSVAPADRNARLMLAEALLGSEQFDNALGHFQKSAEMLPDSPRVWYGLGQTYAALAERARQALARNAPDSSFRHALDGDAFLEQNRYGSAFAAYHKALSATPPLAGVHASLARVYRESGYKERADKEDAIERSAVLAEVPSAPGVSEYRAARSYRQLSRDAYDRLRRLPPSLESHLHAARTFDALGQYVQAAAEWRAALRLAPEKIDLQMPLAWALYRSRDYESVLPLMAAQLKTEPDSLHANFLYGASLVNMERPQEAVRWLQAALTKNPDFRPAQAALGQALLRTGKAAEAIPYLTAAIEADEAGSVRFQLFRAYQVTGRQELAEKALSEYRRFRAALEAQEKFERGATLGG
jgi:tetratricopeptide (TPR) repeat protein